MRGKILPIFWLLGVAVAAYCGTLPNPAAKQGVPFVYASAAVLTACALMTVQTLLLMVIYRPATFVNSWGRALPALLVSCAFLALGLGGAMHAPPALGALLCWQMVHFLVALALTMGMVLFTLVMRSTPQ